MGTVVRIKKINLASWNDTFVDWDTTNNKSDPYFIKVNNVKSLSIVGTSTDPGSAPTTDLTTATILANETTALNRLSFAFDAICDLTVGTEYPAASGNNDSTGVALLYRNGKLCYGGSQDRAAVRYVVSDTSSILSSAAASDAYPIYEMYAEVLGKVTVKEGETVSISDLNDQAANAVLIVAIESGATVNIDATPVENIEFYGDNFSLYNGVVTANGVAVRVMEGATLANLGAKRDFAGWTVDDGVTIGVTQTAAEYGTGLTTVANADNVSSITVYAPDGTTVAGTIVPAESTTLATSVRTSGLATWCDYEFNGDKSNSGTDTTGLNSDVDTTTYPEIFNNSMLYTYTHPYRGITYPNSWTAVVRCTVPELENAIVVTFGTYGAGAIGLVAGSNPEEEMLLVSTPGNTATTSEEKHFTTLATMNVKDATTAQHVYVFTKDGTTVNVYCDGEKVLENYELASATLGGGLQIGSLHGGVVQSGVHTGLVRFGAGEEAISSLTLAQQQNARIDCMRMFNYIVSPEQIAALSVEFPAVKLYKATAVANADTTWGELTWTPAWDGGNNQSKVILTTEGDATVALPESITVDEVQLDLEEGSTLTLAGPGSLTITQPITIEDGTLELTGTVTLTQDTTFNGKVSFTAFTKAGDGAIKLANGATVGVDAELVVTPLGTYTCAEGTVVDSAYTGDGVIKLIPLTSAKISVTQSGTTLYYSDHEAVLVSMLQTPEAFAEDTVATLLNDATLPSGFDAYLQMYGYYIDGAAITKAVAQISSFTYPTLAAAVTAAADGATVKLLRASSEAITLSDKAITLEETANFSGMLTGNGTLTFAAFRNNPSITFTDWTGTVVLPEFAANGTILNNYGVAGSKVVLMGITAGWLGETSAGKMDVNPVLQLDGDVTIKGFSTSWTYTFTEITGEGNFSLDPTDNSPSAVSITKVAEGFTGVITNNTTQTLTIGTLERADGTSTTAGTRLLATGGNVVASALVIDGEPVEAELITKDDGIYIANFVTITVPEVPGAIATAKIGETAVELVDRQASVREDAVVTVTYTAQEGWTLAGTTEYTIDVANNETTFELDESTKATQYVASVTIDEEEVKYTSLSAAIEAASADKKVVKLLAATEQTYEIGVGETVRINKNGIEFNGIVFPEGVQYIHNEQTYGTTTVYTCVLATATVQYPGQEATAVSGTLQQILDGLYSSYVPGYAGTVVTVVDGSDADLGDAMPEVFEYSSEAHTYTLKTMVASYNTGVTTVYYPTLASAVSNVPTEGTIVLVADDAVSFSASNLEIGINKALTIDGGGFTIYGVSDYAGTSDHDIYISGSGDVTIKNVTLADFGGAVPVSGRTYPIWTGSAYAGTLTLDTVTVQDFNRTAFNLNGGTAVVTNCTITGNTTKESYFQEGIGVYNANVTIVDTDISDVGSNLEKEDSQIAACIQLGNPNGPTAGTGSITVVDGTYSGQYGIIVASNAQNTVSVQGGTFTGDLLVEEGEGGRISITGGNFDRDVTTFCADGKKAYEDTPGVWTVQNLKVFTVTFDSNGGTDVATQNVTDGAKAATPEAPTKADNTFAGWTLNSVAYDFDTPVTASITLVATWTPVQSGIDPTDPESKQEVTVDPTGDDEADKAAAEAQGSVQIKFTDTAVTAAMQTAATEAGKTVQELYNSYFTYSATKSTTVENGWDVVATGIAATVTEPVETKAVADVQDVTKTTVEVTVPAGLYYKIETFAELGGTAADTESGISSGTAVSVDKPTSETPLTQSFVRVRISATEIVDPVADPGNEPVEP